MPSKIIGMMKNIFTRRQMPVLFILLVLAVALSIRLHNLSKFDPWFDEIITQVFSHQNISAEAGRSGISVQSLIFDKWRNDPHSFIYYLLVYAGSFLLKEWWSLRLISVIFSMFSLLVFYKLARLIYGRLTGRIALLLMAISPFQVWYAQEMRAYAASEFFALLAALFFVKILSKDKKSYWFYFFISEVFAILTNYYSILLLIIILAFLLFRRNLRYAGRVFLFILIMAVFCIPFTGGILHHLSIIYGLFWIPPPVAGNVFLSLAAFLFGYSANFRLVKIGLYIAAALFLYGARRSFREKNKYTGFLLSSFLLPVAVIFALSRMVTPLYIDRQFIVITPFYYLLIAKGIVEIKNNFSRLLACFILTGIMAASLTNYYNGYVLLSRSGKEMYPGVHGKKQYKPLLSYLYDNLEKDDIVAATDVQSYMLTLKVMKEKFQNSPSHWILFYPENLSKVDKSMFSAFRDMPKGIGGQGPDTLYGLHSYLNYPVITKEPAWDKSVKRIWLVSSSWDKSGLNPANNNYKNIRKHLLKEYFCREVREKDGVILERCLRK